jgi:hypothetical protein
MLSLTKQTRLTVMQFPTEGTAVKAKMRAPYANSQESTPLMGQVNTVIELGYGAYALQEGVKKGTIRASLMESMKPFLMSTAGVRLTWEDWEVKEDALYQTPKCVSRVAELLELLYMRIALHHGEGLGTDELIRRISRAAEKVMAVAEEVLEAEMGHLNDAHQWVHVQEVFATFCTTVYQMTEAVLCYPDKPDYESQPADIEFTCSGKLGGLIIAPYIFTQGSERVRPPTAVNPLTDRRGTEVSYEEIANIYRTTRVSISNIVKKGQALLFKKLKYSGVLGEADRAPTAQPVKTKAVMVPENYYGVADARKYLGEAYDTCIEMGMPVRKVQGLDYVTEEDLEEYNDKFEALPRSTQAPIGQQELQLA